MSRNALLYIADIVAAGDAITRYVHGVSFEAFAANDEKRAAVERQLFILGEAPARLPEEWRQRRPDGRLTATVAGIDGSRSSSEPRSGPQCLNQIVWGVVDAGRQPHHIGEGLHAAGAVIGHRRGAADAKSLAPVQ